MKRKLVLSLIFFLLAVVPALAGNTPKPPKPPAPTAPEVVAESGHTMSFNVNPGEDLEVDTSGDVVVKTWTKNEVQVTGGDSETRITATRNGKTVRVNSRGEETDLYISVPSQFNVDVATSSGQIQFKGLISGSITASTGGGDILADNIDGEVDLRTSGGELNIKDVDGDARLHSSGGDIYVGRVAGNLDVSSGGGNLSLKDVGKNLTAKTGGGTIDAGNIGGTATFSTGGGDVTVGSVKGQLSAGTGGGNISAGKAESSVSLRTSGGDIELGGATGTVTARSSGGSISMDNITGTLEASTSGGEVSAKLRPSGTGHSSIESAGGDITLYVPETAKAKIDATIRIRGRWVTRSQESDIHSDFKASSFVKDEEQSLIKATYILNGGGEEIALETVNSSITIKTLK